MAGRGNGNNELLKQQLEMARQFHDQVASTRLADRRTGRDQGYHSTRVSSNNLNLNTNATSSGRGNSSISSPMSGVGGSGNGFDNVAVSGASRSNTSASHYRTTDQLVNPFQLFGDPHRQQTQNENKPRDGSQTHAAGYRGTTAAFTRQPAATSADSFEPMQVDTQPGITIPHAPDRGLMMSRWGPSGSTTAASYKEGADGMMIDTYSVEHKYVQGKVQVAQSGSNSSVRANPSAVADTRGKPMSKPGKTLLGSRWASAPSPSQPLFPDPAMLEPVYRSDDWLADLSAENKLFCKTKTAVSAIPGQSNQAIRSTDAKKAVQTVETSVGAATIQPQSSHSPVQHSSHAALDMPTRCQIQPAEQKAHRIASSDGSQQGQAPDQRSVRPSTGTNGSRANLNTHSVRQSTTEASLSAELSGTPTPSKASVQSTKSSAESPFNDPDFKEWYNTQYMNRKS